MAENQNTSGTRPKCVECGAELPAEVPLGLCPKCLLKTGLKAQPTSSEKTTVISGFPAAGLLRAGEQLGHYRILGLLGGGGMGSVFEADDIETGRRVALKVLSQSLDSPDARERFFREGRLAASINHPNSVYIFGTEEIAGIPVIAMELVAGGTLEEHVRTHGPMPPGEAVDAILQIIAGLEAAQKVGILHRDIKPSNCFRGLDGSIKVGDFGLSISTAIRTEPALTANGAFLGTPAFCSPEQLRGEELNARSDMYSVGATLFYLLTGRTPFEAKNVVALIATVLERAAPSPQQLRPGIPEGLSKVVRRCLDKQPAERFKSYAELRQALEPYSSAVPVPARLALRCAAGVVDLLALNLVSLSVMLLSSFNPVGFLGMAMAHPGKGFTVFASLMTASLLYYGLSEGLWGATLGKRFCRMRVVGPNRSLPGLSRAFGRAAIYVLLPTLPSWVVYAAGRNLFLTSTLLQTWIGFAVYAILALLFSTARRKNGFAAVHDLVTGTRVISAEALASRVALPTFETPPTGVETRPRVGPYHVLETLEEAGGESWLLGYDLRLLRKVWIHLVPPGTPPVAATVRHLSRAGRLRWLTGTRTPTANWDAFEALDGMPLLTLAERPQPWAQVRFWLFDLAEEIAAAERDGTLPALALDRLWVTNDGRAKLLDFPAPGLRSPQLRDEVVSGAPPVLPGSRSVTQFLKEVATFALNGNSTGPRAKAPVLLPLEANRFVRGLPALAGAAAAQTTLKPLLGRPAVVTRARRAVVVTACALIPLVSLVGGLYGVRMMEQWEKQNPGLIELSQLLQQRTTMKFFGLKQGPTDEQLGVYIASHYRPLITNESSWKSSMSLMMIKGDARAFAERSLQTYTAPSSQQLADAEAKVTPGLPKTDLFSEARRPRLLAIVLYGALSMYVAIPALFAALLFRGGLALRVAGIVLVRRDGAVASRLRLFWRALVAWSPLAAAMILSGLLQSHSMTLALVAPITLLCALAIVSVLLPQRGLPDRFAGTWPVPR